MTSKERLLAAIRHEQPDTVPVSPRIWAFLRDYYGCCCWMHYLQAAEEFDFDPMIIVAFPVPNYLYSPFGDYKDLEDVEVELDVRRHPSFTEISRRIKTPIGEFSERMKWGQGGKEGYGISPDPERQEYLIKGPEDIEKIKYLLPDPEKIDFPDLRRIIEFVGERGLVEVRPHRGVDHLMVDSLGLTNSMLLYYDDRESFVRLLKIFHSYYKKLIRRALEAGAEVIFDSWYNLSLSAGWSPQMLREVIFPLIKEDVEIVHSYGAFHHYYDDGKVMPVIEDIKNTGTDILSTLCPPPMGDVNLAEMKGRIGDTVCLKGYVDLWNVIKIGTPQLIRKTVEETIAVAGPGSGFILGTNDSIRDGTPLENVKAYFEAGRKFGKYLK